MLSCCKTRSFVHPSPHKAHTTALHVKPHHHKNQTPICSTYVRTNVIADFIEKFQNDINMVDNVECQCKYVAYLNVCLIILLLVFMLWDDDK